MIKEKINIPEGIPEGHDFPECRCVICQQKSDEATKYYEWDNLKDLYQIRRGYGDDLPKSKQFKGLLLGAIASLWEYALCLLYDSYDVSKWGIKNGYALTILSPIIIIWWILLTGLVMLTLAIPLLPSLLSIIWMILFELPADVLNKK